MKTDVSQLTAPPGVMLKHPHTGANYYSGEQIISHLNHALGFDGWDWMTLDHGFDTEADEVWVIGHLTARIVTDALDSDGFAVRSVSKTERGWQPVNRKKTGQIMSLGNDYKAAATDALKRCARLLGVGLDAWEKDVPAAPSRQAPAPRPAPKVAAPTKPVADAAVVTGAVPLPFAYTKAERAEAEWKYADLAEDALKYGHPHAEKISTTKPESLDDETLKVSVEKLTAWVGANKPADSAA